MHLYIYLEQRDLSSILLKLEEVTNPHGLGIRLGIKPHMLELIEKNHPQCTERQMTEVIRLWLKNKECSWKVLADAVEKMNCHGKVVDSLRELHPRAYATNMQDEHL